MFSSANSTNLTESRFSHYINPAPITPYKRYETSCSTERISSVTECEPLDATTSKSIKQCSYEKDQHGSGGGGASASDLATIRKSTLSLCSCDGEGDIIPNPLRPLYQYSLDRKRRTMHTYTCEQNAQILLRLEKERQQKFNSLERMKPGQSLSGTRTAFQQQELDGTDDESMDIDFIPPPPPPTGHFRNLNAFDHGCHNISANVELNSTHPKQLLNKKMSNNNNNGPVIDNNLNDITNYPMYYNQNTDPNNLNQFEHHHQQIVGGAAHGGNKSSLAFKDDYPSSIKNSSIMGNTTTKPSNGILKNTKNYEIYFDEHRIQKLPPNSNINKLDNQTSDKSFYFYHQEFPNIIPNYDAQHYTNNSKMEKKFNTFDASTRKNYYSKYHNTTCNLHQYNNGMLNNHNNINSPNLLKNHFFSNSLSNFNFTSSAASMKPFDFNTMGQSNGICLSSDDFNTIKPKRINSTYSINSGMFKQHDLQQELNNGIPWKHRQCNSRNSNTSSNSSTRWDMPSRHWLAVTSILLIAGAAGVAVPLALRVTASAPLEERLQAATQLLDNVPLIDGHNDLPWNIRKFLHNQLNDFHFDEELKYVLPWSKSPWSHTDLVRLKKGRVSAQFWAAYVPCEAQHKDAVQITLEQIDVIKRLTDRYTPHLVSCTSVSDIINAHKNHQMCSLTGVEGGHSLGGSLGVLRTFYLIGVRYVTLTSTCHTPWADSSHADAPKFDVKHGGLTQFGKTVIREMNRLGMIVDLSHVSVGTMRDALSVSEAPVIFSHSSAYQLCNSSRNVQDDILELIALNGGLVMVNFYSLFLSCSENSTVHDAVAHINHIRHVAGIDHVGLGAGFDGINYTPKGLEDVSTYPMLFAELLGDGWSVEDLTKLAGQNFIRVMAEVEKVRDKQKKTGVKPFEDIPSFRLDDPFNCTSS